MGQALTTPGYDRTEHRRKYNLAMHERKFWKVIVPWASYVQQSLQPYANWYEDCAEKRGRDVSLDESAVEWLALACRLQGYGYWCSRWSNSARRALHWGSRLRKRRRSLGNGALALVYGTLIPPPERRSPNGTWNISVLRRMVSFMGDSPDFSDEAPIYREWSAYIEGLEEKEQQRIFRDLQTTGRWFQQQADPVLHEFVPLKESSRPNTVNTATQPNSQWQQRFREDRILRSMAPLDYYLALTAAELLNRAYRQAFLSASIREMLVPTCLCSLGCQRETTDLGVRCRRCNPECSVGKLAAMGDQHHCGVLILSHASGVFPPALGQKTRGGRIGIIGIACAAHLLSGGWRCRRFGLAAQCVPLNAPGCKHWLEEPERTSLDFTEVSQILEGKSRFTEKW